MCNLQKRLIRGILSTPEKKKKKQKNGTAIQITRETTNNQLNKYNSVKHIQKQQFSFSKTSIKVSLSLSLSLQA